MAENKTRETGQSVTQFLKAIKDPASRKDSQQLTKLMQQITRAKPKMWGSGMVGFGELHYKYASGREGVIFILGFAPRKQEITLYQMGVLRKHKELMAKLGKHKASGSCLHIQRLEDIHLPTLKKLLQLALKRAKSA